MDQDARAAVKTSRRNFLKWASAQGAVLVIGLPALGRAAPDVATAAVPPPPFAPNQWLMIDSAGVVTLVLDKSEMGQGVGTALPMILADELGADWERIRVRHAEPGPAFTDMGTAGSGSVSGSWLPLRRAGATARAMLTAAAATAWGVPAAECTSVSGNIVHRPTGRRKSFASVVAAAARLPIPAEAPLRDESELRLLGSRTRQRDVPEIVRGRVTYGIDVSRPKMLHATVARSPVHGGSVRRWNGARAEGVAGVRRVVPISNGIAVVATSTWAAMKGREALDVEWNEGPNSSLGTADTWRLLEEAMARGGKVARATGNAASVLAASTRRMEAEYRWPWHAHASIEPLSCVAHVTGGSCEIWVGTQSPNSAQNEAAKLLGIPADRVTVHVQRLGGAFGRRIAVDYVLEAVEIARTLDAPVQVLWTREDDMQHDMYNPAQLNRMSAALDAAGRPVAWSHRVADFHLSMFGAYNPDDDPSKTGDPWGGIDTPYDFPNLHVELALARSPFPSGAWRAVSYPAAVIARECFLDEVAHATGQDPVALRLSLIPSPGMLTRGTSSRPNGDRLRRVLTLAAERAGWGRPVPATDATRRRASGIACNPYSQQAMVAQVADVSVGDAGDVRVHRVVSAVDCGRVINLNGVEAQFEGGIAWALSALFGSPIEFERGVTRQRTFSDYPVLRMREVPAVEVHVVPSELRPFGMGEPPVPAVGPAVLNAIFAATGVRVRELPIRPEMLAR
jgi:isoquinoline 1-oxidoreductase subunit beta